MKKVYMLICTGLSNCFEGKFKATCGVLFKENPLETEKYKEQVDSFLAKCFDSDKYFEACVKGTENLIVKELEVI